MATKYWAIGGGDGKWRASTGSADGNWSSTAGSVGYAATTPPLATDAVIFDAYSPSCSTIAGATCLSLNASTFSATNTLTLGAALTMTSTCIFLQGTFSLLAYTLQCSAFTSSGSLTRGLNFGVGGVGSIICTGAGSVFSLTGATSVNMTFTGSGLIVTLSGTTTTSTTISSGNALGISNLVDFRVTAGTYSLTTTSGMFLRSLDLTGFSGTLLSNIRYLYGNLKLSSTMLGTQAAASITYFAGTSGTQTITTNGRILDFPITFNGTAAYQLADSMTVGLQVGTSRSVILSGGALDLNGFTLTCGTFSVTNSQIVKSLKGGVSGTGLINCRGAASEATVVCAITETPLGFLTNTILNTLTVQAGLGGTINVFSNKINLKVENNTGYANLIGSGCFFRDLIIGNTVMSYTIGNASNIIAFSGTLIATAARTADSAGVVGTVNFTSMTTLSTSASTTLLQVWLSVYVNSLTLLSDIESDLLLYLVSLSLNNYHLRVGTISLASGGTLNFGNSGLIIIEGQSPASFPWTYNDYGENPSPNTYPTITGTPRLVFTTNGYQISVDLSGFGLNPPDITVLDSNLSMAIPCLVNSLDTSGNTTGSILGDMQVLGACTLGGSVAAITLTPPINTNVPLTMNGSTPLISILGGIGSTVFLTDTIQGGAISLGSGTFNANNRNITISSFTLAISGFPSALLMGSGVWNLISSTTPTVWNILANTSQFTLDATSSTIKIQAPALTTTTFNGGNRNYNVLSLNAPTATVVITGSNTFNNFKRTTPTDAAEIIKFTAGTTNSFLNWEISGSNRVQLRSTITGSAYNLVNLGTTPFSADYLDIQDSHVS